MLYSKPIVTGQAECLSPRHRCVSAGKLGWVSVCVYMKFPRTVFRSRFYSHQIEPYLWRAFTLKKIIIIIKKKKKKKQNPDIV